MSDKAQTPSESSTAPTAKTTATKVNDTGTLINRTDHPVTVKYDKADLVLSPYQRVAVSISKISGELPSDVALARNK